MTEEPPSTRNADALIQALAEEGRLESVGAFTVDRTRAQELLEGFRLADPPAFVLSLLQVAVLGSATRLDARITPTHVTLSFDGEPLTFEDLAEATSALPTAGGSLESPRRTALAEGLFAATALPASRAEILSDGLGGGAHFERQQGQPDRLERRPAAPPLTRITVERRVKTPEDAPPGWEPPEAERLVERGRFAPLVLEVNGRLTAEGPGLPNARYVTPVTGDGFRGVAGVEEDPNPGLFCLIRHGAVISSDPLDTAPAGFIAVVDAPAIRRDLGLARAVRDDAWHEVVRAVEKAQTAVVEQARRVMAFPGEGASLQALHLARRTLRTAYLGGAFRDDKQIQDLAVWPVLGRRAWREHASLAALRAFLDQSKGLQYITVDPDAIPPEVRAYLEQPKGILRLQSAREAERLGARLGVPLTCLDPLITVPHPPTLPRRLHRLWRQIGIGGIVLGLLQFVAVILTLHSYQFLSEKQRWPDVPIQVKEARIERAKKSSSGSAKKSSTVYRVHLKYTYQVGGRTLWGVDDPLKEHDSEAKAQAHIRRLQHPSYRVHYDPNDPKVVTHELESPNLALGVGGLFIGVFGVGLLLVIRHRRRLLREEAERQIHTQVTSLAAQVELNRADPKVRRRRRRRGR